MEIGYKPNCIFITRSTFFISELDSFPTIFVSLSLLTVINWSAIALFN
jgi:hypothetical protein